MVIEGLRAQPADDVLNREANFHPPGDYVGAAVEVLGMLALVDDPEEVTESLTDEFDYLTENSDLPSIPYVRLPRNVINLKALAHASDSGVYYSKDLGLTNIKYIPTNFFRHLWIPGVTGSYAPEELDNLTQDPNSGNYPPHARLAIKGFDTTHEQLLHFVNTPFDEEAAKRAINFAPNVELPKNQLELLEETKTDYELNYPDLTMTALTVKDVVMIAMMYRVLGRPMPISWGFMNDGTLISRNVGGVKSVGAISSRNNQIRLNRLYGIASPDTGIGISVGRRDLESIDI